MKLFKTCSLLYGIVFTALGILGFLPFLLTKEHLLFSLFKVNVGTNVFHLLVGVTGLWVMCIQKYYERLYFQIVGFIFAFLAVLGFIYGNAPILGFIASNGFTTWLHVIAAVIALILGFGTNNKENNERN